MATDPLIPRSIAVADKLREGILRTGVGLRSEVSLSDLDDAQEAIRRLCALLETVDTHALAAARATLAIPTSPKKETP